MAKDTKIEWCDHTANFWWGCHKVSAGCKNCYAETWSKRWGKDIWGTPETTERHYIQSTWGKIKKWDKEAGQLGIRQRVFVQSMSDFLEDHPMVTEWREKAKRIIKDLKNLDILMLTKRPENAPRFLGDWFDDWPPHVWMGTSVENQEQADIRIPHLLQVPAKVRFLSCEPLLGAVDLFDYLPPFTMINGEIGKEFVHWVIVGGESGRNARPMHPDWVRSSRDQCQDAGVAFHFKQWGEYVTVDEAINMGITSTYENGFSKKTKRLTGVALPFYKAGKKAAGRTLDGRTWDEMPISDTITP